MQSKRKEWANLYLDLGLNCIPVHYVKKDGSCSCRQAKKCPSPGKHPALDSWLRYQRVRTTDDDAKYWFEGPFKSHNIGIITGRVSNNLAVIDVDAGPGKDGEETINDLQLTNDDFPDTMMAYTGGGGKHYFFYAPKGLRIKTGKDILGPGVDVRGEGGFVVAAPSKHKSGRPYTMEVATPIAQLPDWLLDRLEESDEPTVGNSPPRPNSGNGVDRDMWGKVTDGRDAYMVDTVLAVIREIIEDTHTLPSAEAVFEQAWPQYERKVKARGSSLEADNRGESAMHQKVAYWLKRASVGQLRVVSGIPLDGKYTEHEAGGSPDEPPTEEPALSFQITDWSTNRYLGEPPVRKWLIENCIQSGVSGILASLGGVGKSFALLDLAFKVCRFDSETWTEPRAFGGEIMRFGSAVVLSAEDSRDELHRRVRALGDDEALKRTTGRLFIPPVVDLGGAPILMTMQYGEAMMTPAWEEFCNQCKAIQDLQLIVIDPLQSFVSADLNSDSTAAARLMGALSSLAAETGATVLGAHHMRKAGSFKIATIWEAREAVRGVAALLDQSRFAICLWYGNNIDEIEQQLADEGLLEGGKLNRADFVQGAIVKSNAPTDQTIRDYIRDSTTGLLQDRTGEFDMAREVSNTISDTNRDAIFEDVLVREKENNHFGLGAQSKDALSKHIVKNYGYKTKTAKQYVDKWMDEGYLSRHRDPHRKCWVVTVKRLPI
jgi:hypothetical protein